MRLSTLRWFTAALLPMLVAAWAAMGVAAQATPPATPQPAPPPQFGISAVGDFENAWFDVDLTPGESSTLTARIDNTGEVPVELRTFVTNAINPPNGGFAADTEADAPTGATRWLDYSAETFLLDPDEGRTVDFTVSVPTDTPAGEYFAALVVQTAEPVPVPGTDVFNQIIRSVTSVEITVPGDMTSGFELGDPRVEMTNDGAWALNVPITNTGTTRLRPQGELVVTTPDGESISATDVAMESVYGDSSTIILVGLPGQLPLGDYLVSLDVTDEATGASASLSDARITLAEPEVVVEEVPLFEINEASVTPNGDPVQYAEVVATITNNGPAIPTANVILNVQRDGEDVESYPLAENQALPQGATEFDQRYIPVDGWVPGTWSFELAISAVSDDTETLLATVGIPAGITIP